MVAAVDSGGVVALFQSVLGRRPESDAVVAHHVAMGLDHEALRTLLLGSVEGRERARRKAGLEGLSTARRRGLAEPQMRGPGEPARLLLWGAYGNGNLGDSAQAVALADILRPLLPADSVLNASSWERTAAYPAPGGPALDPDAIMGLARPRGDPFDLLVIGGGGLFGTPHYPLHEATWTSALVATGIPVVLLGVGGAAAALDAHATSYDPLLRHAALVGARDPETLRAMRRVRADAIWFPDPVLARAALRGEARTASERPVDALLVPRAPNNAADAAALDGMLGWRRAAQARGLRVEVVVMEPAIDLPELARRGLAAEALHQPADWDGLLALCERSRWVASMRLHGTVAGLEAGCGVVGLTQPKTRLLFEELGLEAWFSADWPVGDLLSVGTRDEFLEAATAGLGATRARLQGPVARLRAILSAAVAGSL